MTVLEDADIKTRILLAAKKLFALQGYDGTSIRQICQEAGANVALVSYHFGGKEKLFAALFAHYFPKQKMDGVDPGMNPVEGVKLVIREVTYFRQGDPYFVSIIQQEITLNSPRIAQIREHVLPVWSYLRRWIAEGREQGYFQFRSLDNAFLSVAGILLLHREQPYWKLLQEESCDSEELILDLTDFILHGLHYKGDAVT
ncbi:TetR family transcriptional regulator [Paenibacillus sp. CAU 1782]